MIACVALIEVTSLEHNRSLASEDLRTVTVSMSEANYDIE